MDQSKACQYVKRTQKDYSQSFKMVLVLVKLSRGSYRPENSTVFKVMVPFLVGQEAWQLRLGEQYAQKPGIKDPGVGNQGQATCSSKKFCWSNRPMYRIAKRSFLT